MIRLFSFLFTGCFHKWKLYGHNEVFVRHSGRPVAVDYIMQCEHCGNMKKVRM